MPLIPTAVAVLDEHLATAKPKGCIFETFRRGLATNLHELGVADIVIQAILRHGDVSVTRAAYVKNDAVERRSLAAIEVLESACNHQATEGSEATEEVKVY